MTVSSDGPVISPTDEPAKKSNRRIGIWIGAAVGVFVLGLTGLVIFLDQGPSTPVEVVEELAASKSVEDIKALACDDITQDEDTNQKYFNTVSLMIADAKDLETLSLQTKQNTDGSVTVSFTGSFTITQWLVEKHDGEWKICAWNVDLIVDS